MASHIERRKFLATLGGAAGVAAYGAGTAASDARNRVRQDLQPLRTLRILWPPSGVVLPKSAMPKGKTSQLSIATLSIRSNDYQR